MIDEKILNKINNLVARSMTLAPPGQDSGVPLDTRHRSQCEAWMTEALNVIQLAIPDPKSAYRQQIEKFYKGNILLQHVASIGEILRSLSLDIRTGLLGKLDDQIRAETFDDLLDHAVAYQDEGRKQGAGIIAGVVFEDTVRRICRKHGEAGDKDLEQLINFLKARNLITALQSKNAKFCAGVRNMAAHAKWDEFTLENVAETIRFIRELLRTHLDGQS
jgi:hypothetical protein